MDAFNQSPLYIGSYQCEDCWFARFLPEDPTRLYLHGANIRFPAEKAVFMPEAELESEPPIEIALMGDLTDNVADIAD